MELENKHDKIIKKLIDNLIKKYGYKQEDIQVGYSIETKVEIYKADIVILKDNKPYIIIFVKNELLSNLFTQAIEQIFIYTKTFLNIYPQYYLIVLGNYYQAYKKPFNEVFDDTKDKIIDIPTASETSEPEYRYIKNQFDLEAISEDELKDIFANIRDIIWAGGKRDNFSILNEFNKVLLAKAFDEIETKDNEVYKFQICKNEDLKLQELLKKANKEYLIFENDDLDLNNSESFNITKFLQRMSLLKSKNIDKIYKKTFRTGDYLTPKEIVDFMINSLPLSENSKFLDMGCGSGNFLFEASTIINKDDLIGIDTDNLAIQITKILSLINKINLKNIILDDVLTTNKVNNESFDIVISNPPYGISSTNYKNYNIDSTYKKNISTLFIEQAFNFLKDGAILSIILTDNILSNRGMQIVRNWIKEHFQILSIISFNTKIFYKNSSNIKFSILILKKIKEIKDDSILMIDIQNIDDFKDMTIVVKKFVETNTLTNTLTKNFEYINLLKYKDLQDRLDVYFYKKEFLELEKRLDELDKKLLVEYLEKIFIGKTLKREEMEDGNIPLLTAINIESGKINIENLKFILEKVRDKYKKYTIEENDILIVSLGQRAGNCAIVSKEFNKALINEAIFVLKLKDKQDSEFIKNYLNSKVGKLILKRYIRNYNNMPTLIKADLEQIPIVRNYEELEDNLVEKELFVDEKEKYSEENNILSINGLYNEIFGVKLIKGFIKLDELVNFKQFEKLYQREIDKKHENGIYNFLKENYYKFLPEMVFAIDEYKNLERNDLLKIDDIDKDRNFKVIHFKDKEVFESVRVIDGNHRLGALKKYIKDKEDKEDKEDISIAFILLSELDKKEKSELYKKEERILDKAIFYNLNAKSKPLIITDYLNLFEMDIEELESIDKKLCIVKNIFDKLKDIFSDNEFENLIDTHKREISEQSLRLADYWVKYNSFENFEDNHDVLTSLFKDLLESKRVLKYEISAKANLLHLLLFILNKNKENINIKDEKEILLKEIFEFLDWLENIKVEPYTLKNLEDFETLYETCKATYIPKSRRIFISMPYHKETEWTYYLIKDVINEVSRDLNIEIKVIRTDEESDGIHTGVREKVYEQISESDLMIADLTGNNPNVFNEIGFKMGLDKGNGLKEPQIIFVVNTASYYEEIITKEIKFDEENKNQVNGKIKENKFEKIAFNLSSIRQIKFKDSAFLKTKLREELHNYFKNYQILKG